MRRYQMSKEQSLEEGLGNIFSSGSITKSEAVKLMKKAIDSRLPKEKSYLYESRKDNKDLMKSAIAFKMGYNSGLSDVRKELGL